MRLIDADALKVFIQGYAQSTGAAPSATLLAAVRHDAIPLLVERLEAAGTLRKASAPPIETALP